LDEAAEVLGRDSIRLRSRLRTVVAVNAVLFVVIPVVAVVTS
jgi:hypothetical protein